MTLAKFRDARDYPARSAEYFGEPGNSAESGARISINLAWKAARLSVARLVEDRRGSSRSSFFSSQHPIDSGYDQRERVGLPSWKRARNRGHSRARLSNYRAERQLPERGMKKRDQSGGSRPLSRRRRCGERIIGIVPVPGPPLRGRAETKRRTRGEGRTGARELNSKFGTNNADPCFVSPWEINASASGGLIAPRTRNSNNIYLRRVARAMHGMATRALLGTANAIAFDVCAPDRPAIHKKRRFSRRSIGSPRAASRRSTSLSFIYCP
jgi:hypothetical protein